MSIRISLPPSFERYTNDADVVEVNGSTVGQCLDNLVAQFPGIKKVLFDTEGNLLSYFEIYVNKETAYPEGLVKPVQDGDELHIVVLVVGG